MKKLGRIQQLDDDEEDSSAMNKTKTGNKSNKEEKSGFSLTNLAQVGVGIGALAVGGFALWKASKMTNEEIIPNLVENEDQLRKKLQKITKDAETFPVVGLSCFYTEVEERRSPVVLIAISSHKGETILISLDKFTTFPQEIRKILENLEIVKTGVEIDKQAGFLFEDHGLSVYSTFDLRFLSKDTGNQAQTLSLLAGTVLDIGLGPTIKDWTSIDHRCQKYAENHVETTMNLFKTLYSFLGRQTSKPAVLEYCNQNLNKKFLIENV